MKKNMRRRILRFIVAIALILAILVGIAYCLWFHDIYRRMPWTKEFRSTVLVTVTDRNGKPVSGCDVDVVPKNPGLHTTVRAFHYSDSRGIAQIDGVPAGEADVSVTCLARTANRECDSGYDSCLASAPFTQDNNEGKTAGGDISRKLQVTIGKESPQVLTVQLDEWTNGTDR